MVLVRTPHRRSTIAIPITIVISATLADGDTRTYRAYSITNIISQRRRSNANDGGNNQGVFHGKLLFLIRQENNSDRFAKFQKSNQTAGGTSLVMGTRCDVWIAAFSVLSGMRQRPTHRRRTSQAAARQRSRGPIYSSNANVRQAASSINGSAIVCATLHSAKYEDISRSAKYS